MTCRADAERGGYLSTPRSAAPTIEADNDLGAARPCTFPDCSEPVDRWSRRYCTVHDKAARAWLAARASDDAIYESQFESFAALKPNRRRSFDRPVGTAKAAA
jgi:hypothetical protein